MRQSRLLNKKCHQKYTGRFYDITVNLSRRRNKPWCIGTKWQRFEIQEAKTDVRRQKNSVIMAPVNTTLSGIGRTSRKKDSKETKDLHNSIYQAGLLEIYRVSS